MQNNELIGKIKKANKLEDIVGKYVELKYESSSSPWLIGFCPFHKEKEPSFKVNRQTQTWHCWSCHKGSRQDGNKGSDVIAFVQEIEDIDFNEAMEYLAKEAGIPYSTKPLDPKIELEKDQKTKHNRRYHNHLWDTNNQESINALQYLKDRGLTEQTIYDWRLGLVPNDEFKIRSDIQNIAGKIAIPMIEPINTDKPKTISMSYRAPNNNYSGPKYKNDTNTIAFQKADFLFGLNFAIPHIKKKKFGIILEDYFGTIAMHQLGIQNVVSVMGVEIATNERLYQMQKYSKNWVLMLDNDEAGFKGMVKALPKMLEAGLNVDIVLLPEGIDADELSLKLSIDEFKEWFDNSRQSLVDLVINRQLNDYEEKTNKMKVHVLNNLSSVLNVLNSPEIDVYNAMINRRLGL